MHRLQLLTPSLLFYKSNRHLEADCWDSESGTKEETIFGGQSFKTRQMS